MAKLTAFTSYADAQANFSSEKLWELFDGNREQLNIAHECVDRYARQGQTAVIVLRTDAPDEIISYEQLAKQSSQMAHFLTERGIKKGDRVAVMLEPSQAFYTCLFGIMKAGAIAVPLFTLFGPDGLNLRIADCLPSLLFTNSEKICIVSADYQSRTLLADDALIASLAQYPTTFTPSTNATDYAMYHVPVFARLGPWAMAWHARADGAWSNHWFVCRKVQRCSVTEGISDAPLHQSLGRGDALSNDEKFGLCVSIPIRV